MQRPKCPHVFWPATTNQQPISKNRNSGLELDRYTNFVHPKCVHTDVIISKVPWALPYSTWYHQFPAFPIQALTTAILLKEYTLTDRGTYLSLQQLRSNLTSAMELFKTGTDSEEDPLLLPGHLLVGNKARNSTLAYQFANWAVSASGQRVVTGFQKNGMQLYSGAP
jgi:hypothetical protein